MRRLGIDISEHNGILNWDAIKKNGAEFAIIRFSQGHFEEDKRLRRNVREYKYVKMPYGLYHYSYVANDAQMREEASGFIKLYKTCKPNYPCYIDMEDVDGWKRCNGISDVMNAGTCYYTCWELEKTSFYIGIYASPDWLTNHISSSHPDRFDKWVAQWVSISTYRKPYRMWQFTSNGSIHSYNGRTDLDYAYRDYPAIMKEKRLNGYGKTPGQPKPDLKPNPSKNPKYEVGAPVTYTSLWTQVSDGSWYPRKFLAMKEGIITRVIKGAEYPYLINDNTKWTNNHAIDDEPTRPSRYQLDVLGRRC